MTPQVDRIGEHILRLLDTLGEGNSEIEEAHHQGSLTLAMGKCLWFSVKIKVCQSSLSSP